MDAVRMKQIAEAKSAFAVTTDKKGAFNASWELYGSFFRLLSRMEPPETPIELGWGYGYPSELLTATRVMAGVSDNQTMNHLGEFRGEFNNLFLRIQSERAKRAVAIESIRNFGTLLLEGHELIEQDTRAGDFIAAKSMAKDLDKVVIVARDILTQTLQT